MKITPARPTRSVWRCCCALDNTTNVNKTRNRQSRKAFQAAETQPHPTYKVRSLFMDIVSDPDMTVSSVFAPYGSISSGSTLPSFCLSRSIPTVTHAPQRGAVSATILLLRFSVALLLHVLARYKIQNTRHSSLI